jgi:transglutaminase-like putative cysteine protease
MPRLRAKHRTELHYAGPVMESVNELRMTPKDTPRQCVISAETSVEPEVELRPSVDAYGNRVLWFQLAERHDHLLVEAEAVVEVTAGRAEGDAEWRALKEPEVLDALAEFLSPSRFVRWTPPLTGLAAEIDLPEGGTVRPWLAAVERGVGATIEYSPGSTGVDTPVEEVVHARRGVCQDMAHVMISICRCHGVPARYVSGWLHQPGHDGPAESHAWVEAYVGDAGWIELDPTHPGMEHLDYVRIGIGRDYADVPPIKGSYVGPATDEMAVVVTVDEVFV